MADEKQPLREEVQENEERRDDLELPEETADQVKGGDSGWDAKPPAKST